MGEAVEDSGIWKFLVGSLRRFLREFSPGLNGKELIRCVKWVSLLTFDRDFYISEARSIVCKESVDYVNSLKDESCEDYSMSYEPYVRSRSLLSGNSMFIEFT